MDLPDVLMLPVAAAVTVLKEAGHTVRLVETAPCSNKFPLLGDCQYVLRQTFSEGVCYLVVAAKMGKEVQ
ncbi:MAG: hypothetical protein GYA36_12300 [Veillonellaceae bacterium]|jgi:hypothetical protein|nr:hypothetical protein [Veillonellaceae bacterium]